MQHEMRLRDLHPALLAKASISVPGGWYKLADEVLSRIEQMHKDDPDNQPLPAVRDIKEKYGSLRIYFAFATNEQHALSDYAESQSELICMQCSSPGILRTNGWLSTLCDAHYKPSALNPV